MGRPERRRTPAGPGRGTRARRATGPAEPALGRPARPARLTAAEAWLTALRSPGGRLDADPDELDALAKALRPWDDEGTGLTGPARVTFRLVEATASPGGD
jgi:hypothetical protein